MSELVYNTLSGMNLFRDELLNSSILYLSQSEFPINEISNVEGVEQIIAEKLDSEVQKRLDNNGVLCIIFECRTFVDDDSTTPDICIGTDTYHTPRYLMNYTVNHFQNLGYNVEINTPYSGCSIPDKFYNKNPKVSGIMIGINKRLYMNGDKVIDNKVSDLNTQIRKYFDEI